MVDRHRHDAGGVDRGSCCFLDTYRDRTRGLHDIFSQACSLHCDCLAGTAGGSAQVDRAEVDAVIDDVGGVVVGGDVVGHGAQIDSDVVVVVVDVVSRSGEGRQRQNQGGGGHGEKLLLHG